MNYIDNSNPYCIKDGIPMILFERGNHRCFLCGHCGGHVTLRGKK